VIRRKSFGPEEEAELPEDFQICSFEPMSVSDRIL
jgi:hypothetical protein